MVQEIVNLSQAGKTAKIATGIALAGLTTFCPPAGLAVGGRIAGGATMVILGSSGTSETYGRDS